MKIIIDPHSKLAVAAAALNDKWILLFIPEVSVWYCRQPVGAGVMSRAVSEQEQGICVTRMFHALSGSTLADANDVFTFTVINSFRYEQ